MYDNSQASGSMGTPPKLPYAFSRVCVAVESLVGVGKCKGMSMHGEYRVHTRAYWPAGYNECDNKYGKVNFVKAHVDASNTVLVIGNVGH